MKKTFKNPKLEKTKFTQVFLRMWKKIDLILYRYLKLRNFVDLKSGNFNRILKILMLDVRNLLKFNQNNIRLQIMGILNLLTFFQHGVINFEPWKYDFELNSVDPVMDFILTTNVGILQKKLPIRIW